VIPLAETLTSLSEFFSFTEGTGHYDGSLDEEALAEETKTIGKTAVAAFKADESASTGWRNVARMLMSIRAGISVEHKTGRIGPDWDAKSDLAKRYTSYAVSGPLRAAGFDDKQVTRGLGQINNVLRRTVPGSDSKMTLREQLIREFYRETHEDADEQAVVDYVNVQYENMGLKTMTQTVAEREAKPRNTAGPQTRQPESPSVVLAKAVDAVVASEADLSVATLIEQAHRVYNRIIVQLLKSDDVPGRPEAIAAEEKFHLAVNAVALRLNNQPVEHSTLRAVYLGTAPEATTATDTPEATPEEDTPDEAVDTPEEAPQAPEEAPAEEAPAEPEAPKTRSTRKAAA
jgi:hypothetical protein